MMASGSKKRSVGKRIFPYCTELSNRKLLLYIDIVYVRVFFSLYIEHFRLIRYCEYKKKEEKNQRERYEKQRKEVCGWRFGRRCGKKEREKKRKTDRERIIMIPCRKGWKLERYQRCHLTEGRKEGIKYETINEKKNGKRKHKRKK